MNSSMHYSSVIFKQVEGYYFNLLQEITSLLELYPQSSHHIWVEVIKTPGTYTYDKKNEIKIK